MPCLLVDDSDGRVVATLDRAEQALRLLERVTRHNPDLGAGLSVVHFRDGPGSVVSASSSLRVRVLPDLPGARGVPDLRR